MTNPTNLRFIIMALLLGFLLGMEVSHYTLVVPAQANTDDAIAAIAKWKSVSEHWESNTKAAMAVSALWETVAKKNESSAESCLESSRKLLRMVEATK